MIKFIKKHKLNFIIYFLCAFAMALFTFISFSCKTYAFTIDNNGNLVGDNLFDYTNINSYELIGTDASSFYSYDNGVLETTHNSWFRNIGIRITLQANTTYTISAFSYSNNGNSFIRMSSNNPDGTDLGYINFTNNNEYTYNYFTFTTTQDNNVLSIGVAYNGDTTGYFKNIMLNEGDTPQQFEPYGVWYSSNNYNAVIEDNEDLQQQIDFRDTSSLLSGIKTTLDNTNLKIYNSPNLSLTQMLGTTPFHIETISFPNVDYNYNMEYCNIDTYNAIMNNNGEFSNGDTLTNNPTLLYTFKTPLFVSALSFSRNDTSGTRFIDFYFTDNTSTELLLTEGSDNNRLDITWINTDNKYIQYISTTAEIGFNCVYAFTIPNSNQIYTSGYANGYSDGMYEQYQNDASSIQNANQEKQAMYSQGYSKGIEDASKTHDLGWSSLFFAMADTPFKVVSNVLGFELFGLNLFATFIGMITVFGVVYLLKKFL